MNLNLKNVQISGIRRFYNKVSKVEGAISLTLGQPDFPVPKRVKDAIVNAVLNDKTVYTENAGIKDLREEISRYLNKKNINYSKEDVMVTIGGSEGLYSVFSAILNKGDSILIPNPAYPAYENISKIVGANVINYNLKDDFSIDFVGLQKIIREKNIKVLVLSYPSNPTGAILSKEDSIELHKIIKNNNITVVSDEIYEALCFSEYNSIAQFNDILDKVIYISGFSKMFSMTGLRLGYLCAKEKYFGEIMKVHQYNVSCAPSIVQYGVLEGLKNSSEDVLKMKNEFINRKNYVVKRLEDMGIPSNNPSGAFYVFANIKKFNLSSEEFCTRLLNEGLVACVPGDAFGTQGEGYMRISYCYSIKELAEALDRIEKFIKSL